MARRLPDHPLGFGSEFELKARREATLRPERLEVTVLMEPAKSALFTDALIADLMREVRRQMEPEYAADGRAERVAGGGMRFFFTVSERGRR